MIEGKVVDNTGSLRTREDNSREDADTYLCGLSYERRWEIITAYLELLEGLGAPMGVESELPYSKEDIRLAIFQELVENPNSEFRDQLEIAYMQLETFVPYDDYKTVADFKCASLRAQEMTDSGDPTSVMKSVGIMRRAEGDRAVKIQEGISEKMRERFAQIRGIAVTARVMNRVFENSGQACF
jgi:hypothetical protein